MRSIPGEESPVITLNPCAFECHEFRFVSYSTVTKLHHSFFRGSKSKNRKTLNKIKCTTDLTIQTFLSLSNVIFENVKYTIYLTRFLYTIFCCHFSPLSFQVLKAKMLKGVSFVTKLEIKLPLLMFVFHCGVSRARFLVFEKSA